jgi:hypothetical protein
MTAQGEKGASSPAWTDSGKELSSRAAFLAEEY